MPTGKKLLVDQVIDRITGLAATTQSSRLPTVSQMARQFGVGAGTVLRAIRELVRRGIVTSSPGRGITVATPAKDRGCGVSSHDSAARVADALRRRIEAGDFVSGACLPTVAGLVSTFQCGPATAIEALRRLERRGLVHSRGKRRFAGPGKPPTATVLPAQPREGNAPVVLVYMPHMHTWHHTIRRYNRGFFEPFVRELEKQGYQVSLAFDVPYRSAPVTPFTVGRAACMDYARKLGDRFAGILFFQARLIADIEALIVWFCHLKRPVVIYEDLAGSAQHVPRFTRRSTGNAPNLYSLYIDEPAAMRCAIEHVCRLGHSSLHIPEYRMLQQVFIPRRIEALRAAAAQGPAPCTVHVVPLGNEEFFSTRDYNWLRFPTIERYLESQCRAAGTRPWNEKKLRDELFSASPAFTRMIQSSPCTVIAALNDVLAHGFLLWLQATGIRVPENVSLLSFDNKFEMSPYPVSSVDFGLGELGFRAAHLMIGDLPIRTDKNDGTIAGTPRLIDRGSLAPPHRGKGVIAPFARQWYA